jgi:hypothetical protein
MSLYAFLNRIKRTPLSAMASSLKPLTASLSTDGARPLTVSAAKSSLLMQHQRLSSPSPSLPTHNAETKACTALSVAFSLKKESRTKKSPRSQTPKRQSSKAVKAETPSSFKNGTVYQVERLLDVKTKRGKSLLLFETLLRCSFDH